MWMPSLTPLSNQRFSFSSTLTWLLECPLPSRCSCPENVACLCWTIRLCMVHCIPPDLYGRDAIVLFVSWCFVIGVDQSLSEGDGGFEPHWDIVFLEVFPEFSGLVSWCRLLPLDLYKFKFDLKHEMKSWGNVKEYMQNFKKLIRSRLRVKDKTAVQTFVQWGRYVHSKWPSIPTTQSKMFSFSFCLFVCLFWSCSRFIPT